MLRRVLTAAFGLATLVLVDEANADEPERVLPPGHFLADDGVRPFAETHADGTRPYRREPHFYRAAFEDLFISLLGTGYYWLQPHANERDWDFKGGKSFPSAFVPSFDTNRHVTNDILHPIGAGAHYYWFARANGLTIPWALAYSFTSSAMFEFVLEWLERASINDLTMTPGGGLPAGEFFVHVGDYLQSSPSRSAGRDALSWSLGFPSRLHRQNENGPQHAMPADNLGFSSYYWHRFQFMMGAVVGSNYYGESKTFTEVALNAQIVAIPGFLRPGNFSLNFSDGEFTEGFIRADIRNGLNQTYDLGFAALLFGHYHQDIGLDRKGHAWALGLESAYQFAERIKLDHYDAYALLHLFGVGAKWWWVNRDVMARLEVSTSPDFAILQNMAWPTWKALYGDEGTKLQLQQEGYDFEYGWSARARATLEISGIELGARALAGAWGSFDRWYRFQSDITRNVHQSDQLVEVESWLGATIPQSPIHLQAYAMHVGHTTTMQPITTRTWDNVVGALAGVQF